MGFMGILLLFVVVFGRGLLSFILQRVQGWGKGNEEMYNTDEYECTYPKKTAI